MSVDGNVTLGENIADQGGLRIAEIAYEKWLQGHAETAHSLPALEFTHRQLFYLGYALPWCATHTDAMMRYEKIMFWHRSFTCGEAIMFCCHLSSTQSPYMTNYVYAYGDGVQRQFSGLVTNVTVIVKFQ